MLYLYLVFVGTVAATPASWVQKIAESNGLTNVDDYIPKYDPLSLDIDLTENILPLRDDDADVTNVFIIARKNKTKKEKTSTIPLSETFTEKPTTNSVSTNLTNNNKTANKNTTLLTKGELDPIFDKNATGFNATGRTPRQEVFIETNNSREKESQEESSEEEGGNMLTGLLSAFLGGLSKPDGGIDIEAIVGLLGSLSTQNPNGTYEFSGLTELLRSFFGGGGDDGGGSDVGAFTGGLLGAVIRGLANPPNAKGAGLFTGKVAAGILPALSAPSEEGNSKKGSQLDAGGFLVGFLKPILASSGGGNGQGGTNKFTIIKTIISLFTSILSGASSLSSKSDWAQNKTG